MPIRDYTTDAAGTALAVVKSLQLSDGVEPVLQHYHLLLFPNFANPNVHEQRSSPANFDIAGNRLMVHVIAIYYLFCTYIYDDASAVSKATIR